MLAISRHILLHLLVGIGIKDQHERVTVRAVTEKNDFASSPRISSVSPDCRHDMRSIALVEWLD